MFPPRNQQRRSIRTSSSFICRNKLKGLLAIIALCIILCVIYAVSGTNGSNIRVQFTPFVDVKAYEHSLHTQSTSQSIDERERRGLSSMQSALEEKQRALVAAQRQIQEQEETIEQCMKSLPLLSNEEVTVLLQKQTSTERYNQVIGRLLAIGGERASLPTKRRSIDIPVDNLRRHWNAFFDFEKQHEIPTEELAAEFETYVQDNVE